MGNLCADITMNVELQGRLLGRLADQSGWECHGWITFGPEMSVVKYLRAEFEPKRTLRPAEPNVRFSAFAAGGV
jgi:hypothetical protein